MFQRIAFLSTLSLRRATFSLLCRILFRRYFYPRSPYGERRQSSAKSPEEAYFYPRSPYGERQAKAEANEDRYKFLSTLSLRRATRKNQFSATRIRNFYPRSPYGERQILLLTRYRPMRFLSTLSLRRATYFSGVMRQNPGISIHALLTESDRARLTYWTRTAYFYPRSPYGERRRT